jgi:imidazolonepropionase-like amidohydrolase
MKAEWGTLARGKIADVILVDGRPDRNISDSRNIADVFKNGELVDRESLKFDVEKDPGFRISTSVASQ